jgi:hypothetical protein
MMRKVEYVIPAWTALSSRWSRIELLVLSSESQPTDKVGPPPQTGRVAITARRQATRNMKGRKTVGETNTLLKERTEPAPNGFRHDGMSSGIGVNPVR